MTDHDLGDLILGENQKRDTTKSKGILTIVALLIAILVIAIMMAQMVLDDNDENSSIISSQEEGIVSSELQLDESIGGETQSDEDELDDITTRLLDNNSTESNKTSSISNEVKPDIQEVNEESVAPIIATPITTKDKPVVDVPKPKPVVKKPKPKPAPKPKPKPKAEPKPKKSEPQKSHISKGSYYIQVGSFTKKPSSRFLSVIKNSGFSYKLHNSGKLLIGSYSSREMANRDLSRVKDRINKGAFIINIK